MSVIKLNKKIQELTAILSHKNNWDLNRYYMLFNVP